MGNNCSEQQCEQIGPNWVKCTNNPDLVGQPCQCCNIEDIPINAVKPLPQIPAATGTVVYQGEPVGFLSQGHGTVYKNGEPHTYLYFKLIIDALPQYNVSIDQITDFIFTPANLTMKAQDANDPTVSYKIIITLSYDPRYFLNLNFLGFKRINPQIAASADAKGPSTCKPWNCSKVLFDLDFNVLPVAPAEDPSAPSSE